VPGGDAKTRFNISLGEMQPAFSFSSQGYVYVRRVGSRAHLVIWADAEERVRLCRFRDHRRPGNSEYFPAELTRLKVRSDQK
jgi:hypothetical protein